MISSLLLRLVTALNIYSSVIFVNFTTNSSRNSCKRIITVTVEPCSWVSLKHDGTDGTVKFTHQPIPFAIWETARTGRLDRRDNENHQSDDWERRDTLNCKNNACSDAYLKCKLGLYCTQCNAVQRCDTERVLSFCHPAVPKAFATCVIFSDILVLKISKKTCIAKNDKTKCEP